MQFFCVKLLEIITIFRFLLTICASRLVIIICVYRHFVKVNILPKKVTENFYVIFCVKRLEIITIFSFLLTICASLIVIIICVYRHFVKVNIWPKKVIQNFNDIFQCQTLRHNDNFQFFINDLCFSHSNYYMCISSFRKSEYLAEKSDGKLF